MKTWIDVEKAFCDAGIEYQQKDWVFLVEIESRKFYYSPQSGKWRIKRTRAWQKSKSVADFLALARKCLRSGKESKEAQKERRRANRKKRKSKKKSQKTKSSNSQRQQNYQSYQQSQQELRDEVRPEFLELFDEKIRICNERNYKPAWIWKVLLDKYLLTPKEICWLCTIFDYSPGWAFHQAKGEYPELAYKEILASIGENRSDWLKYFNSRWQFSYREEARQEYRQQQQNYKQQRSDRYNSSSSSSSTKGNSTSQRYQSYLDILQLNFPFSRKELKKAYRQKALKTHPDTGGDSEVFRQVHAAFEIL